MSRTRRWWLFTASNLLGMGLGVGVAAFGQAPLSGPRIVYPGEGSCVDCAGSCPSYGQGKHGWKHGCSWCKDIEQQRFYAESTWIGFPREFHELPLGYSLNAHNQAMVVNGEIAQLVFYHYDFIDGASQLNHRGREKIQTVISLLASNFEPVIIEMTPCVPTLDEARRVVVAAEINQCGFPIPDERVVVGPARANGLRGPEAELIYRNLLIQTQNGLNGAIAGGGSGGGGPGPAASPR